MYQDIVLERLAGNADRRRALPAQFLPLRLSAGLPIEQDFPPARAFLRPFPGHGQGKAIEVHAVRGGQLHGRMRLVEDLPAGRSQAHPQQLGIDRHQDDVGRQIGFIEVEWNGGRFAERQPAVGIEHDLVVGHAGKDLQIVLGQTKRIVGIHGAGHQHVAAGAVGQRVESDRLNVFGRAETDGEHAIVDQAGHFGDIARPVFVAVGQHDQRLEIQSACRRNQRVAGKDAVADRRKAGVAGGEGVIADRGADDAAAAGIGALRPHVGHGRARRGIGGKAHQADP